MIITAKVNYQVIVETEICLEENVPDIRQKIVSEANKMLERSGVCPEITSVSGLGYPLDEIAQDALEWKGKIRCLVNNEVRKAQTEEVHDVEKMGADEQIPTAGQADGRVSARRPAAQR
ncbi:MAG: hypothetical protein Q8K86_08795 [Candidatus Nanopelagicaceae bacterium]|nr:hypothetical protein [Candidatus Nanopelagicaceae bacterium]